MKVRSALILCPFFLLWVGCSDPFCGDQEVNTGEACDDGNDIPEDGCESDCTLTPPETIQTLFEDQLVDIRDAALVVKQAAEDGDLNRTQQQWRILWRQAIKVRYIIFQQTEVGGLALQLFSEIGKRDFPGLPGIHAVEAALFGRVANLNAVPGLIDDIIVVLDTLLTTPPTITNDEVFQAALNAYQLPIELFAGTETPLAGPDEDAFRNVFISTSAYFQLIPGLLEDNPELDAALDELSPLIVLSPDSLPGLIAESEDFGQTVAQIAEDLGLVVNATPQDDFSALSIPTQFGDNFTLIANQAVIDLGKLLFFDPILSENDTRACSFCHKADDGFGDSRPKGLAIDQSNLPRNTPTIFNSALQIGSFWDSRVNDLPDQAIQPIQAPAEMGTNLQAAVDKVAAIQEYQTLFTAAFGPNSINAANLGRAIGTWESSETLILVDSPVDQFLKGDANALNTQQKNGLGLFFGKARCGNCHFAPIFGGSPGPNHNTTDLRVIGVPQDAAGTILDPDLGKGGVAPNNPDDNHSFKVPILRQLTETGPYMHNGVFTTLTEVITFYNAGGGPGLNFTLPNADPRMIQLNLTQQERADLEAFLGALTDTVTPRPQAPVTVPSGLPVNGIGP